MEIPDTLHSLFSTTVHRQNGSYILEVPETEIETGTIEEGSTYRVALLPAHTEANQDSTPTPRQPPREPTPSEPPVEEGETRTVEIEDIGDQGDGLTRVERGFVVIVPDTETGERVTIEITDVQENVAFATVTDRKYHVE